jgi:hypothetical protein
MYAGENVKEITTLFMKQNSAVLSCFCLVGGFVLLSYCDYKNPGLLQTKKERKKFRHIRFQCMKLV